MSASGAERAAEASDFSERELEIDGWPVRLTHYRVDQKFICQADNVSPGACLARFSAASREDAEFQAISKARHLLAKTKRREILD